MIVAFTGVFNDLRSFQWNAIVVVGAISTSWRVGFININGFVQGLVGMRHDVFIRQVG